MGGWILPLRDLSVPPRLLPLLSDSDGRILLQEAGPGGQPEEHPDR